LRAFIARAGLAGGRVDWVDSLAMAERHLTKTSYSLHVLDLGSDPAPAVPLLDALAALPDRRTVLICDAGDGEVAELRHRFPAATVLAGAGLRERLCGCGQAEPPPRRRPGSLETLIDNAAALRVSLAGIGRQMAIADDALDAGKPLDGQIHLGVALRRLAEAESRIGALEAELRARAERDHTGRT
jgi:hypothetical protein